MLSKCQKCSTETPIKNKTGLCFDCWSDQQRSFLENKTIIETKYDNSGQANQFARIRNSARKKAVKFIKPQACLVCGYETFIEVCHIKSITSFPDTALVGEVNDLNNLIFLCPNHHKEFDSGLLAIVKNDQIYKSDIPGKALHNRCVECNIIISKKAKRCVECSNKHKKHPLTKNRTTHIEWPQDEVLQGMVWEKSLKAVGRELGVTGNSVKDRCRRQGIECPPKDYFWMKSKNKENVSKKIKCMDCENLIHKRSKRCLDCSSKNRTKIIWPCDEQLLDLVWTYPRTKLAELLGVSDNAIKKHCLKRNIDLPSANHWK